VREEGSSAGAWYQIKQNEITKCEKQPQPGRIALNVSSFAFSRDGISDIGKRFIGGGREGSCIMLARYPGNIS